jgi:hypothetical protein
VQQTSDEIVLQGGVTAFMMIRTILLREVGCYFWDCWDGLCSGGRLLQQQLRALACLQGWIAL